MDEYGKRFNYNKLKKLIFFTDPFEIKGLEFDYVFIVQFDRKHYPSNRRIEELNEKYGGAKWEDENFEKDYDVILNDEKKISYVASSRARKELNLFYVAGNQKRISPFVWDFNTPGL